VAMQVCFQKAKKFGMGAPNFSHPISLHPIRALERMVVRKNIRNSTSTSQIFVEIFTSGTQHPKPSPNPQPEAKLPYSQYN